MKTVIEFLEWLRFIVHVRYTLAGLAIGALLGSSYKRLVYGPTESGAGLRASFEASPGDDAFVIIVVVCALVGIVLDIRRSLNNRG